MIAIIDYGMGNLRSVEKAFHFLGHEAQIFTLPEQADGSSHLVLPGDAAFGDAMNNLNQQGWSDYIHRRVEKGTPFLGICVGLQLMFSSSQERGQHSGLGLLPGQVLRFPPDERVPQIGWNQINIKQASPLLQGVPDDSFFYFVHSYYVDAADHKDCLATTEYGLEYTSIAAKDHVFGVQFHPEKSQDHGLKLLDNFARMD